MQAQHHPTAPQRHHRSRLGIATASALVATLALAALTLPPSQAEVVGAGTFTGTLACDTTWSNVALTSDHLVHRSTIRRHVTASVEGADDCRVSGMNIQGNARLTGDGIACGHDPTAPFTGFFVLVDPGTEITGGFHGTCIIDGAPRRARYGFQGAVIDGQLVGILQPSQDAPA